ncbi:MAG TPA: hypothetical protein VFA33_22465 [Bryobacteraceae bacterium]|nr:hypothetical protein [Bryobacteraceae bacterium]
MLVRFTIEGGCIPVTEQAREDLLNEYLRLLADYDPDAEDHIRNEIRQHLNSHTQFTAAWIACDGPNSWRQEFHPLYHAIERVATDAQTAHDESGKFLGLLVWNEALNHRERWHFTKYPKLDADYMVTHYFAMDGHICASAKRHQAETARRHGDIQRATDLENAARALQERWRRGGR